MPKLAPARSSARAVPSPSRGAVRLTRRGRIVVLAVCCAVLSAAFSIGRATSSAAVTRPDEPTTERLVVHPGDTLWGIAHRVAPGTDPRITVMRLMERNDLDAPTVRPGQALLVAAP